MVVSQLQPHATYNCNCNCSSIKNGGSLDNGGLQVLEQTPCWCLCWWCLGTATSPLGICKVRNQIELDVLEREELRKRTAYPVHDSCVCGQTRQVPTCSSRAWMGEQQRAMPSAEMRRRYIIHCTQAVPHAPHGCDPSYHASPMQADVPTTSGQENATGGGLSTG